MNDYINYTGRHKVNEPTIKHINSEGFYILNHPLEINLRTGNATFPMWTIKKYNKNYIFQYYDKNFELKTILVGRKQVSEHCFPLRKKKEIKIDPITGEEIIIPGGRICCYGIKISDIFKYGEELHF